MRFSYIRILPLLLSAAALFQQSASAQVLYGSIVGNVRDPSDAVIVGATVVATNTETGQSRQAVTNAAGSYTFPTLQAGSYEVKVSQPGFASWTRTGIAVSINNVTRVDITLRPGAVSESVTISSDAPQLQTDRAEVRAEISNKELIDLPGSPNRNYQYLLNTVPGVTPFGIRETNPSNATGSSIFNVNGASNQINNTRIDGASTTNIWQPQYTAYTPAIESIGTVNVVTNSYDAEQGLAGGAAINVELKSGTNEFHGSAFEYHHNQHLRARNFFLPEGVQMGKYVMNQWGGTLGGPIKRDKVFFFGSFEAFPDRRAADRIASVPSAAVRSGDMSSYPTIYDPLTGNADGSGRTPFPGNRIPENRKDPITQKIIPLIPAPNLSGETRNYFVSAPTKTDRMTVDSKVNWNVTDRSTVFGRFSYLDMAYENGTIFGDQLVGDMLRSPGNPGFGSSDVYSVSGGGTHVFMPNFIVDGNIGYVAHNTGVQHPTIEQNVGLDFLGIPGTNGPNLFQGGWPRFDLSTYDDYGVVQGYMPYWRWDDQMQYVTNFNLNKGTHEIRWGMDLYYQAMNHTQPEVAGGAGHGARGNFVFGSGPTRLCTNPDGAGGCRTLSTDSPAHSFATFLMGLPTRYGKNLMTVDPFTTRQWAYSFYIRDKWQVNRKLTVSYGTRWEYFPVPTRDDRGLERFDAAINKVLIGGIGDVPVNTGVKVSKRLFAPRLGIAWRPTDTFVIRTGYGISIDPYSMARAMRTNYPVIVELDRVAPNAWQPAGTLAAGIPEIQSPDLGNGIIDIPRDVFATTMPNEFRRGYVQSWNFTLQKELPLNLTAEAGYVATRQIRQLGFRELNWAPIGAGRNGQQLFQQYGRSANTRMVDGIGNSHYDSLQARLQRRFSNGLMLQAAYTFSKSITTSGQENSDGTLPIAIPEYYHLNRQLSGFDRPHNLQVSYIWELPFGRGKPLASSGWSSWLFGGWQTNGLISVYSGSPFTVTSSGTSLNAPGSSQRADQVKPEVEIYGGAGRGQAYFDPRAFAPVTERRFGTAGFNSLRGPGVRNWDAGIYRNFRITERWQVQFRADAYNVTNTPQFGNPGANVDNLRLDNDGSIRDLNGFGEILSATGERQFRFGLRLSF